MTKTAAPRDAPEVRHFVEQLALSLVKMGFPPMPARVWAFMISHEADTVTPGEISAHLEVSPAAVSGALRYLVQMGLTSRVVGVPGSRRQHYQVTADMWADAFIARQSALTEFSDIIEGGIEILGADSEAGQRVAEIRDFFQYIAEELPRLLEEWRAKRKS
ncbi:MAG: MarR family transcriptional regulator [Rhodococcus sp. (in: high G+C Gram-positive bacteria)]|uniref:GbsR/MarR family transcriptional regulator n=1 Tax=Rhodococcus sp. TaxID=1831 RepID=UPI003BAF5D6B